MIRLQVLWYHTVIVVNGTWFANKYVVWAARYTGDAKLLMTNT
jgi:hypothetical protein